MRILKTTHSYLPAPDGVAQVVGHVAERLARLGHEVHVATSARKGEPRRELRNGVEVHRFAAGGSAMAGLHGEIEAYRALMSEDWDVIVAHCIRHWALDAVLDMMATSPGRFVFVSHGMPVGPEGYGPYYARVAALIPRLGAWACVSRVTEERDFAAQFGLPEPILLQNGVDPEEWRAPPLNVRSAWRIGARPWVVNVSNHTPHKGHPAYHALARQPGLERARFTLIGRGYPMERLRLGRLGVRGGCWYACRARSLRSGVELRAAASRQETVSAIVQADVIVATSRWEANSVVLLEAMAAGTPWVSFDVGSAAVNEGGLVVSGDADLAACVAALLADPDRRAALGAAGRQRVLERHSWDRIVQDYDALIRRVGARAVTRSA